MTVNALAMDLPQMSAIATIDPNQSVVPAGSPAGTLGTQKNTAISTGVSLGFFENNANATVGNGATIVANGAIDITGKTTMPYSITFLQLDSVSDILNKISANFGIQSGFFTTWVQTAASGKNVSLAGSINYFQSTTNPTAIIGQNAHINEYAFSPFAGVSGNAINLGAPSYFQNGDIVVYQANGGPGVTGLQDGAQYQGRKRCESTGRNSTEDARWCSGDHFGVFGRGRHSVPYASRLPGAARILSSRRRMTNRPVNLSGNFGTLSFGTTNTKNGIGAAYLQTTFTGNVTAQIQSGAHVNGDTLTVRADNSSNNGNLAVSGGSASDFGFDGAGGTELLTNNTFANIADGAVIHTGTGVISIPREFFDPLGDVHLRSWPRRDLRLSRHDRGVWPR